jgi:hypothetical protein
VQHRMDLKRLIFLMQHWDTDKIRIYWGEAT